MLLELITGIKEIKQLIYPGKLIALSGNTPA